MTPRIHLCLDCRMFKCTVVCAVCRPSVRCPSVVVKFSHFRLFVWNSWTKFNETWQEARYQRPLPKFVLLADPKNKIAARPPIDWEISDFSPLKPLNRIQWNLTGSKTLTSSTTFMFFGPNGKKDGHPALTWLRHFRLLHWNRWRQFNGTWQEARSQSPRLPLWNHWKKFNETECEARSQRPLPRLWFSERSEKQDGCIGLWLTETFFLIFLWHRLTEFNEIWSKISTSSTNCMAT